MSIYNHTKCLIRDANVEIRIKCTAFVPVGKLENIKIVQRTTFLTAVVCNGGNNLEENILRNVNANSQLIAVVQ